MERARQSIRETLETAKHPAVFWSGGKDSQLLLSLVREVKDVPVIWFRHGNNEFANRMIMEWDLEVWSWAPSDVYVLPNDNGLTFVREQSFGSHQFPVLLDINEGNKCIADFFPFRTPQLFPHFDVLFIGYKDSDEHSTLGGLGFCPADGWELGKAKVYAPLRHLNDEQVWTAIRKLNVPYDVDRYERNGKDPSEIEACTRCLQPGSETVFCPKQQKEIERVTWNPDTNLKVFRQRFGFDRRAA